MLQGQLSHRDGVEQRYDTRKGEGYEEKGPGKARSRRPDIKRTGTHHRCPTDTRTTPRPQRSS